MSLSSVLAALLNGGDIATRTTAGIPWLQAADAVGKASLLLGAAGLASLALRRASASVRHLIWTLALVGSLVVPALSIALPRWSVPVVTIPAAADVAPAASATPPPVSRKAAREASAPSDAIQTSGPIAQSTASAATSTCATGVDSAASRRAAEPSKAMRAS